MALLARCRGYKGLRAVRVGCCERRAQVEAVRVQHDLRNQRIGTKLMDWVIARARARGRRLVQWTTNIKRQAPKRF